MYPVTLNPMPTVSMMPLAIHSSARCQTARFAIHRQASRTGMVASPAWPSERPTPRQSMPPSRYVRMPINTPMFTMAESAVARARPACSKGVIRTNASTILRSMAATAAKAGVFVSWSE